MGPEKEETLKTIGEKRVRIDFNVENQSNVDLIKKNAAMLIDAVNEIEAPISSEKTISEFHRLKALAMTSIEEGAMWAVKAATI